MIPPTILVPVQGSIYLDLGGGSRFSGVTSVEVDANGWQIVMHGADGPKLVEFGDSAVTACDLLARLLAAGRTVEVEVE